MGVHYFGGKNRSSYRLNSTHESGETIEATGDPFMTIILSEDITTAKLCPVQHVYPCLSLLPSPVTFLLLIKFVICRMCLSPSHNECVVKVLKCNSLNV